MKKTLLLSLIMGIVILSFGCSSTNSIPSDSYNSTAEKSAANNELPIENEQPTADKPQITSKQSVISYDKLNEIAASIIPNFDETIQFGWSDNNISYYSNDIFELFCSDGIANYSTILAHRFSDDSWHWVDMGSYSCQNIGQIYADPENPKLLRVEVDGNNFCFDHELNDFERCLRFDENFQNPEIIYYGGDNECWNAELLDVGSVENIIIKNIEFSDNAAHFTFDLAGEPVGNGYPYPHISFDKDIDINKTDGDRIYYIYKFYFHNTHSDFPQKWIDALKSSLHANAVSVAFYNDSDTFDGTLLKIACWYEPGIEIKLDLPSDNPPAELVFSLYTK